MLDLISFSTERFAIAHLRQTHEHLEGAKIEKVKLLYAASMIHLSLHTLLIMAAYSESGLSVLKKESRERLEAKPLTEHENIQTKDFKRLLDEFLDQKDSRLADLKAKISNVKEQIVLLAKFRNLLEHPKPGAVNGFTKTLILDSIEIDAMIVADFFTYLARENLTIRSYEAEAQKLVKCIIDLCVEVRTDKGSEVINKEKF
ncbi:MAG: hypothetical protein RJS98_05920 [Rhodospirillaceae bacterium]